MRGGDGDLSFSYQSGHSRRFLVQQRNVARLERRGRGGNLVKEGSDCRQKGLSVLRQSLGTCDDAGGSARTLATAPALGHALHMNRKRLDAKNKQRAMLHFIPVLSSLSSLQASRLPIARDRAQWSQGGRFQLLRQPVLARRSSRRAAADHLQGKQRFRNDAPSTQRREWRHHDRTRCWESTV